MVINGQHNILGESGINRGRVEHRIRQSRELKMFSKQWARATTRDF